MQLKRFGVTFHKGLGICNDEGEVAATARTEHLPGEDVGHGAVVSNGLTDIAVVFLGMANIGGGNHAREHGGLRLEGGTIGCGKGIEVALQDGRPAGFGGSGQGFDLGGGDILTLND